LYPSIKGSRPEEKLTIAYARVSCHDQKEDLERQEKMLEMFCSSRGWSFELIPFQENKFINLIGKI